jgi:hypothetical protein
MGQELSGTAPVTVGGNGRPYVVMIPVFGLIFLSIDLNWSALFTGRLVWEKNPLQDGDHFVIFALISIALVVAAASPSYVKIFEDRYEAKGTFSWSTRETRWYRDVRRFENRYQRTGRYGYWQVYAVLRTGELAIPLPLLGAGLFSKLKAALLDWQTKHGALEPLPLADMSASDVQY